MMNQRDEWSQWPLPGLSGWTPGVIHEDVLKNAQVERLVREEFSVSGQNETLAHSQGKKMIEDMSYLKNYNNIIELVSN